MRAVRGNGCRSKAAAVDDNVIEGETESIGTQHEILAVV
jgi:hypothetical protein